LDAGLQIQREQKAVLRGHLLSLKLISPTDLTRAQVASLFARADAIANGASPNLQGMRVGLALFNMSFPLPLHVEQTLRDAGADIIPVPAADRINAANPNVVLFSSPQTNAARDVAVNVNASFLNAGDGTNENPVRALMDAYAIYTLKGDLQSNRTAILGNAKFSAEAHSLARLLGMFQARISFVTTAPLSMPYDLTDEVRLSAYEVEETNDLATTLKKTDALYLANIDPIRVEKKIYDKQKSFYTLAPNTFAESKEGIVVLGEWDGAEPLLSSTRPHVERAARAMLLALVEFSVA
jgi:aspartate carbamoyltransferase catalytic subunit